MPDVRTQTLLTGSRMKDYVKEIRSLKQAKYQRTYLRKKQASKRMVKRIVKDTLEKQKKSP